MLFNAGKKIQWKVIDRPVTSFGHQERGRVFLEGPTFFLLCPIFLNYVQHIFPGGRKFFQGREAPPSPPWLRAWLLMRIIVYLQMESG